MITTRGTVLNGSSVGKAVNHCVGIWWLTLVTDLILKEQEKALVRRHEKFLLISL